MSDHNSGTPGPNRLKFDWGPRENQGNVSKLSGLTFIGKYRDKGGFSR